MAEDRAILYERRGPLALITLNRPDKLNALTQAMTRGVIAEARRAEADPEVYAICVTGAGRGFCAGIDAEYLRETTEQGLAKPNPDELPALFSGLLRISKPVIAAVNGPAAGGGFILAMMSDLRFMADGAILTTVFTKRGLIAEHGSSWLLPRIVGASRALDLLWSSRRVDAAEALRIGLADRVVPPEALISEVEAYAAELAANTSPRALAVIKDQVYRHLHAGMADAFWDIDRLMRETLAHPDAREGAVSFLERRPPRFAPWTGGEA
jgi:enoyl-CoA hydratase/carnithine racemase